MTNKEIALNIIGFCKANDALNAYILEKFNKRLTYTRGLNLKVDYYSANDYAHVPIVIFDPETKNYEQDGTILKGVNLQVKIVHKDEFKKDFEKIDDVIVIEGLDEIEDICAFIEQSIIEGFALLGDLEINTVDTYYSPVEHISNYTEYNGHIVVTFTKDSTIGGCL